jgi:hypothetical protein
LKSNFDVVLFGGAPGWFPLGVEVTPLNQMPVMPKLGIESIPSDLCSFDQPSRVKNPAETGLHFYSYDKKFRNVLAHPESYLRSFMNFKVILCPDISISPEMPIWVRIRNTHLSRCVGAYFSSRQLTVIPSLRWVEISDLDFVTEGIPHGSVIAVGALGTYRNPASRLVFETGISVILERLKPAAIIVYGQISHELEKFVQSKTRLVRFNHPMAARKTSAETQPNSGLFVA